MPSDSSAAIEEQYATLTMPQRAAVNWQDGPLLLLAGPGSGKTRVLTNRIARLLSESEESNFRVLALTFTNRAADEMRTRIEAIVPGMESRLFVGTFHAFCTEVLRRNGMEIGVKSDFTIYSTDEDRREVLEEFMRKKVADEDRESLSDLKLLPLLDRIAARLIAPEAVRNAFRNKDTGAAVGRVYGAYLSYLNEVNIQDFSSLVTNAYTLFEKYPTIANRYRRTYRYWNIDEFQDTNYAQFQLLLTIAKDDFSNIFIVADDDQIIYQWNGASFQRLQEFSEKFSPEVIQLPTNFRCPSEIVELGNRLIAHNRLRRSDKAPLMAAEKSQEPSAGDAVSVLEFDTDYEESVGVAEHVRRAKERGEVEIAVLARSRRLLVPIQSQLEALGVPARVVQRKDSFQSTPFIWLQSCLRQAHARGDVRNLRVLVETFNELAGIDVSVEDVSSEGRATSGDYFQTWLNTIEESEAYRAAYGIAREIRKYLMEGSDFARFSKSAVSWFEELGSPPDDEFAGYDEDSRAWKSLMQEIRSSMGAGAGLDTFLQELDLRSKEAPMRRGEVALMTIHAAKGNEFDCVFVVGLAEDVLPSFQAKKQGDDSPELEEERRNCFVAITRTKKCLTMSHARRYWGYLKQPSRFLAEMELAA